MQVANNTANNKNSPAARTAVATTHMVDLGRELVRSMLGTGTLAILIAALGLVVTGCGTIPEGLAGGSHSPLVELSRTSLAGESLPGDDVAQGAEETAAVRAVEGGTVSAEPGEPAGDEAGGDAPPGEAAEPSFVPVALDLMPSGLGSHLVALADEPASQGSPESAPPAPADEPLPELDEIEEYDPWEKINEKIFAFNYRFDRYLLKPVARVYNVIMPDMFQQMIGRGFDNIRVVPKLVNNILQWNWKGFSVELGRFLINSSLGIGGLFDIARQEFGLEKTRVDFGQTLGKWGVKPGPFVIVPFMAPLTVRDGIGLGVDTAMDPLGYFIPFIPDRLVMRIGDIVNDRSLNLELFQGFEETTVDLYAAVRNAYLQRRYHRIHGSP
jgi:phospholipid-binding lipoprotein MlaA